MSSDPKSPTRREFTALDRPKLSHSIVAKIVDSLRDGQYEPGSPLPSERVLAEQFAVSRGSVREALRVLEYAGIVEIRVGSGINFTDRAATTSAFMRAQAALVGDHSPLDILTARLAVEPACARLAASARRDDDLEALRTILAEQRRLTEVDADPSEPDSMFHIAIARATGNDVLEGMSGQLLALMREGTWSEMKARTRADCAGARRFLEEHEEILDAIVAGDADAAENALRRHLQAIEQRFAEME